MHLLLSLSSVILLVVAPATGSNDHVDSTDQRLRTTTRNPKKNLHVNLNNNTADYKILLESFANPKNQWVEMNDPVMGGKSTGSFHIDETNGIGIFTGAVNNVPFLHAPGFIQVRTTQSLSSPSFLSLYPDISHCQAFELIVSSQYPQYRGYRMSFGTKQAPHGKMFAYGYKTNFTIFENNDKNNKSKDSTFQSIILPFLKFTDYWDDATGDAIIECNPDDSHDRIYCPTAQTLHDIQTIGLWGEGYAGDVNINIQAIYAIQCNDTNKRNTRNNNNNRNGLHNPAASDRNDDAHSDSWWSRFNQLLSGNSAEEDATRESSSSSSSSSKTTTTALLQRNMLLASLHTHRW